MTLNILSKLRGTETCDHKIQMRMEIAGLSREVCQKCGRVSVRYVEDHFHNRAQLVGLVSASTTSAER